MAAWIAADWPNPAGVPAVAGWQAAKQPDGEALPGDWVLALAGLVVGDRQEKRND